MRRSHRQTRSSSAPLVILGASAIVAAVWPAAAGARDLELALSASPVVAGEAIVRFERDVSPSERLAARRGAGVVFDRALRLPRTQVVELEGSIDTAVKRLERQPDVAFAQPNYVYGASALAPDDGRFDDLWGLDAINVLEAWDHALGSGQVIAVVDTGVDLTHPDLADRLWTNVAEIPGNDTDDDGNGVVDDVHGADFVDESSSSPDLPDPDGTPDGDPDDLHYHGTHVAGTAAAEAGNGAAADGGGIAGVAPGSRIMAVRVLDAEGSGTTATVADGIEYAADNGADVINLSLGGEAEEPDLVMSEAINHASDVEQDPVVVAAAGNDSADNDAVPHSPCVIPDPPPNLLCVAAAGTDGQLASFSNWGADTVDLAAPGVGVLSALADYRRLAPTTGPPFGFESGLAGWTAFEDTVPWQLSPAGVASSGSFSATDSPGGDYPASSTSSLVTQVPDFSLVGERGCRMHYALRLETPDGDSGDFLDVGVLYGGADFFTVRWRGDSEGDFMPVEMSLRQLDGSPEVAPAFILQADADANRGDGAYVDQVQILCRDDSYGAVNYTSLNGTSMAAPHVAGVAALVREAAGGGATAAEAVDAIVDGAAPVPPTPGKPTGTGRALDACRAVVLAADVESPCISHWMVQESEPPPPTTSDPLPTGPADNELVPGAPFVRLEGKRARVSRARWYSYPLGATSGARGDLVVRKRVRIGIRRVRHLTLAHKRFVVPASGKVQLRIRLSKRQLRLLLLDGRFLLNVRATVRDSRGRAAVAAKRLVLLPPRHR